MKLTDILTPRQIELMQARIDGGSLKAGARTLGMSVHTAQDHMGEVKKRMKAASCEQALVLFDRMTRSGSASHP